jgi:hypothetical protein
MSKPKGTGTDMESLMDMLAGKDGATRQKARKALVALGKPAVSSLTQALQNSRLDHLRWEAAKTLGAIGDARAIPSLVEAVQEGRLAAIITPADQKWVGVCLTTPRSAPCVAESERGWIQRCARTSKEGLGIQLGTGIGGGGGL